MTERWIIDDGLISLYFPGMKLQRVGSSWLPVEFYYCSLLTISENHITDDKTICDNLGLSISLSLSLSHSE